jgi:hypothetical protein
MTNENQMTHAIKEREPTEAEPKPTQRTRRGLFKAGAMLIPTLITLHARPALAQGTVPTAGGYGASR